MYLKSIIKKKGKEKPSIAIVGCLHGDEIIGKLVINELRKLELKKGGLTFIIGHPEAVKKRKRFLERDLNRIFPGKKNGCIEEKIAYDLSKIIKRFDLVIDIHATNSDFKELAIITKYGVKEKKILKDIPIKNIALIDKKVFGGKDMISYAKLGVSLDYGPDKTGKNFPLAVRHIKNILKNVGVIDGVGKKYKEKNIYTVSGTYDVSKDFKHDIKLKDFKLIKKSQLVGKDKKGKIFSKVDFYPLFLGDGRYNGTLALIAKKKKVIL